MQSPGHEPRTEELKRRAMLLQSTVENLRNENEFMKRDFAVQHGELLVRGYFNFRNSLSFY